MLSDEEATRVVGAAVVSADGEEVGEVVSVLTHAADNRAAWALVDADGRRVLVPLDQAQTSDDRLEVRYSAEQITSAPEAGEDTLDADAADEWFEHYGIDDSVLRDDSGFAADTAKPDQGTSRDPRGGGGADDAAQAHP
jgi:hypothetical protein